MIAFSSVGLLYPGDMGASVARLLVARGARVVTTLVGRSENSARRAREAGIEPLDSLADVVRQSDLVLSFVSPSAAAEVADAYCELAHLSPPAALYVDANSTGPELARTLADKLSRVGRDFVDAAINGLAKNISVSGTLYLSGARANDVEQFVGDSLRVRNLGNEPGRASTMKMLLGGLSKGICALFLELALTAQRREMLPEMLEAFAMIYPGVTAVSDRVLPTYAHHAGRRASEMRELEQTLRNSGIQPCLIEAIRHLHEQMAEIPFKPADGATVISLIQRAITAGLLAAT